MTEGIYIHASRYETHYIPKDLHPQPDKKMLTKEENWRTVEWSKDSLNLNQWTIKEIQKLTKTYPDNVTDKECDYFLVFEARTSNFMVFKTSTKAKKLEMLKTDQINT